MAPNRPGRNSRWMVGGVGMLRDRRDNIRARREDELASQLASLHAFAHWRSMRSGNVLMPRMVR